MKLNLLSSETNLLPPFPSPFVANIPFFKPPKPMGHHLICGQGLHLVFSNSVLYRALAEAQRNGT